MPGDGEQSAASQATEEDILNQFMPEGMQEEMFCFTMGDCELHEMVSHTGRQLKKCEFMNSSLHLTSMPFDNGDGQKFSIPVVVVCNDDYDENQDQKQEEKLPIAENLIFMKYEVEAKGESEPAKIGYVFYYPEIDQCQIIEAEVDKTPEMRGELQQFEQWICKVLYVLNEKKPLREASSSRGHGFLAEQDRRCAKYCIPTELEVLEQQSVIGDIFFVQDGGQDSD